MLPGFQSRNISVQNTKNDSPEQLSTKTQENDVNFNIDKQIFQESALLANEKNHKFLGSDISNDFGSTKSIYQQPNAKNYQSVGELNTDRVFKNAALN